MAGARHGGAEAFFMRLVPALAAAGLEQCAVIRRDRARAERLGAAGVGVVEVAFGGALDRASRRRFRRAIADFAPSVVMTWMNRATRHCPSGEFVHVARLGGYYDPKYYRRCDHLVANTADIRRYLIAAGWAEDRVHYLPNFVEAASAPPLPRAGLGTPEDAPLILGLGRLHPNKAFDVLLAALDRLPAAYLWLAGAGPAEGALGAMAARLGLAERVRFLGWREDVAALLAAADVLVCASRHEPLGNVVIEAWAQRVPVVAAASQGPAALITDGESGLLVPPEDAAALAEAIARVLDDPALAARLAEAGHAAFAARYSEAAVVPRYLDFFAGLAR